MTMVLRPGDSMDDLLATGQGGCPACGGVLRKWGYARLRVVRDGKYESHLRPGRVRCADCGVTQVVLPAEVLVRRRDAAAVIGRAWRAFAAGAGARRVARQLAVPMETVRGWLRRLRGLSRRMFREGDSGGEHRLVGVGGEMATALAQVTAEAELSRTLHGLLWSKVSYQYQGKLLSNTG